MEDDTTTVADNQTDADKANQTDQTTTDQQTDTSNTGDDNLTNETTEDDTTSNDSTDDGAPASKFDADIDEWAKKTNRPAPQNDTERALYQEIRDGQREFSRSKQAKDATTDISKSIDAVKPADDKQEDDDRDPVEIRQDEIEAQLRDERALRVRSEYFNEHSVTAEQSKVMGEILKEKVDRAATPAAKKAAFDYWTDPVNLEDWHALAKARLSNSTDTTVVQEEAARKERERIAKESQAAGGTRNAKTTTESGQKGYDRSAYLKSDD